MKPEPKGIMTEVTEQPVKVVIKASDKEVLKKEEAKLEPTLAEKVQEAFQQKNIVKVDQFNKLAELLVDITYPIILERLMQGDAISNAVDDNVRMNLNDQIVEVVQNEASYGSIDGAITERVDDAIDNSSKLDSIIEDVVNNMDLTDEDAIRDIVDEKVEEKLDSLMIQINSIELDVKVKEADISATW